MAKDELASAGVKLDYVKYSDKPTCLAIVSLSDSGSASYEFVIENTATFDFTPDWLPNLQTERPALLHPFEPKTQLKLPRQINGLQLAVIR